jgi:hypothetical protein
MTQITFPLLDQNGPAPQTTDFRAARAMFDCSLRSRGSRLVATAFFTHSQTKSVSARSFVQDSGAILSAREIRRLRPHSEAVRRL